MGVGGGGGKSHARLPGGMQLRKGRGVVTGDLLTLIFDANV